MPGHRYLVILAFGKALRLTGPVGLLPINFDRRFISANRAESDAAAIWSPDRISVGQRLISHSRFRVSRPFVHPDVLLLIVVRYRYPPAIRRKSKVKEIAEHWEQRLCLT